MADLNIGINVDASQLGKLSAASQEVASSVGSMGEAFAGVTSAGQMTDEMLNALYPTETSVAAAANEVASATGRMASAMGAARVEMGLLEGSTGMMAGGLARVAAQSETLAPLLQAAFVPVAILAGIDIISELGEKVYHAYENIVLLKDALGSLNKMGETEAQRAAELNYQYEESYARRLEATKHLAEAQVEFQKAEADKPLALPKIDDKNFKQFNAEFVTFLQAVHTSADAPSVITRINAEAKSAQDQLEQARLKLANTIQMGGTNVVPNPAFKRYQADVTDLTEKLAILKAMVGEVQSQIGINAEATATRLAEANQKTQELAREQNNAADATVAALARITDEHKRVLTLDELVARDRQEAAAKESEFFAKSQEKDTDSAVKAAVKSSEAWAKYYDETAKLAEQSSLRKISGEEQNAESAGRLQLAQRIGPGTAELSKISITEQVNEQILARDKLLENQRLAVEMDYLNQLKQLQLGGQTEKQYLADARPEELSRLANINSQIEILQSEHVAKMKSLSDRMALDAQNAANQSAQAWLKTFQPMNAAFETAMDGIIRGTQRPAVAFRQMGEKMVLDVIHSGEQMLLKTAELELRKLLIHQSTSEATVAADATAAAETKSISASTSLAEVGHAAASAAAKAYSALAGIPVVGPELGAAAAAATFVAVMALESLASAQGGAIIPEDMPVYAHAGEMVLPTHLSEGVQNIVNQQSQTGGSVGGDTHLHVNWNALDSKSLSDFLHQPGVRSQFTKALRSSVRNGTRLR
jgi:hypothetical protein